MGNHQRAVVWGLLLVSCQPKRDSRADDRGTKPFQALAIISLYVQTIRELCQLPTGGKTLISLTIPQSDIIIQTDSQTQVLNSLNTEIHADQRGNTNRFRFPVNQKISSPQQGDLRLSGPPSGQGTGSGARTRDRMVPADLRADSQATVLPTPP
ncbi:hypothetical protein PoB_002111300 [Plakobranchus ocellatus]|uniref:Uncharacterized protein n=1 Tax=Plakobranchus ocellatus TaxID=259542 RepID=A0AAV3ZIF8_9GAST|nr:hypothetical protein PoB_002111300 [Plakobranchus ocellatus]